MYILIKLVGRCQTLKSAFDRNVSLLFAHAILCQSLTL